jgi:DNA polymerase III delta subunit
MPKPLQSVLTAIEQGKPPRVFLIGGNSEFLAEDAFRRIRDAIVAANPSISVESYEPGTDLGSILDSYRTMSLFGGARLLIVPEVNAFVSAKEIASLYDKAVADWKSAKTDRKRASSAAKLLHVMGVAGADLDMKDRAIADSLGVTLDSTLTDLLAFCRNTGKKAGRGEDDAALLMEAIARGGATGTILLMRTGEIPRDSATIDLVDKNGAVIVADLTRDGFVTALDQAIATIAAEANVRFDQPAIVRLRARMGFERMLADKFSKDVPEMRGALNEVERLVTLAGPGGRITTDMIDREIAAVEGGARYELGSLFTEGKILEAITKLRELVAQGRREDPIGIHSWAKVNNVNLKQSMNYNRFKDTIADRLGDYMKAHALVRQRPHPFPLLKKWEAARTYSEADLFRALSSLADLEIKRKSGGLPSDLAVETFLLQRLRT